MDASYICKNKSYKLLVEVLEEGISVARKYCAWSDGNVDIHSLLIFVSYSLFISTLNNDLYLRKLFISLHRLVFSTCFNNLILSDTLTLLSTNYHKIYFKCSIFFLFWQDCYVPQVEARTTGKSFISITFV